MVVQDIANGSEIKIYASIGGHNVVLMTEAIFGVAAGLLVKPMEYFGRYMQFLEPSSVQVRNKRDGRVYRFMSTTITPVKTRYGNFHLIRCSSQLEPENTRKAERFNIEKLGVFTINGNNNLLKNCIVHDISLRGMSIILIDDTKIRQGDRLEIKFRYGETLHLYEVSTIAVRNFVVSGKPAIGCSIVNMNVDLVELVTRKKAEKGTPEAVAEETNLNPAIPQKQQIQEVDEDIARQLIPERPRTPKATTNTSEASVNVPAKAPQKPALSNPFDPAELEHISRDSALRSPKQENTLSEETRAIERLLNLRDV